MTAFKLTMLVILFSLIFTYQKEINNTLKDGCAIIDRTLSGEPLIEVKKLDEFFEKLTKDF